MLTQALQQIATTTSVYLQTAAQSNDHKYSEIIGAFLALNATTLQHNPALLLIATNSTASTQLLDSLFQLAANALFSRGTEPIHFQIPKKKIKNFFEIESRFELTSVCVEFRCGNSGASNSLY